MSELEKAIDRLSAFIRLKRQSMSPVMVDDIDAVIQAAKLIAGLNLTQATRSISHCECHERDSSYVCDFCKAQGLRGHLEKSR